MNYRKKSPVVQAVQYNNEASVMRIMEMIGTEGVNNTKDGLFIDRGGNGRRIILKGWWVVESHGMVDTMPDEWFAATYEKVEG